MGKKVKSKYYVVWVGANPGIYSTWNQCKAEITAFPNAKYKSFPTELEAKEAYRMGYHAYSKQNASNQKSTILKSKIPIIKNSISVDAACSGNPGKMEYRGVITISGEEIFRMGPFDHGTNNVGEFLALVHGLALLYAKENENTAIYTDSRTAMAWIRKKKMNSKLARVSENEKIFDLVARAEKWLNDHDYKTQIIKWETKKWGEIPADFGRK